MAYRDFKLSDLENKFGIEQRQVHLFDKIKPIEPSAWLIETLRKKRGGIRPTTEKAVSESTISAILTEVQELNQDRITLFSGENLNADRAAGLNGEVDFLFVNRPDVFEILAPVFNITEAKFNQAIERSIAQAAAQMLGARIFNQKNKNPTEIIFGCVTNANQWLFLKLEDKHLSIDKVEYSPNNLPELLGAFQTVINFYEKKNNLV
jgi:hypothetical protein